MSYYEDALQAWAEKVDPTLPQKCPKCGHLLDRIRYTYNINQMTIHLTHAVNRYHYYVAFCPYCSEELKREGVRTEFLR